MSGLRAFAERLLFSESLEDKLAPPPGDLRDDRPGSPAPAPAAPGRPESLRFRPDRPRPRFPADEALGEPEAAAAALHAFANHELLACELMALALLRFPDAEPAARRELLRTLADEQRHLRDYLERLGELGGRFGDLPTSAFFWDVLAGVPDLRAFHAGMGLTLEQANLDFALHYEAAFRAVGDARTAELLDRVRRDEIVHVARGRRAFERAGGGEDLWAAWTAVLPAPLTPRRARGRGFDLEGRRKAGLPEAFIARVRAAGGSRGRRPDVYAFDVLEDSHGGRGPGALPPALRARGRDLADLALVVAGQDDLALLARPPSAAWRTELAEAGFRLGEWATELPAGRPLGRPRPWSQGAAARRLFAGAEDRLRAPLPPAPSEADPGRKCAAAELLADLLPRWAVALDGLLPADALPRTARDEAEVVAAIRAFRAAGRTRLVVKADRSSSGRERVRLLHPEEPDPNQTAWMRRRLRRGPLRVEPWLPRVLDLSFHLDVADEGARARGWVRFVNDERGSFRHAELGDPLAGLPDPLRRFLAGRGPTSLLPVLGELLARDVGEAARAAGVRGPVGVDTFVYRDDAGGLRMHPLVEVNARWTMGRVALLLGDRVAPRRVGRWVHRPLRPGEDPGAVLDALRAALPLERRGDRIARGVVATNDPAGAEAVLTLLVVAEDPEVPDRLFPGDAGPG